MSSTNSSLNYSCENSPDTKERAHTATRISILDIDESSFICTKEMKSPTNNKIRWVLFIKPDNDNGNLTFSLLLNLSQTSMVEKVFAIYDVSVFTKTGEIMFFSNNHIHQYSKSTRLGMKHFLKKDEHFTTNIMSNGKLKIQVTILFSEIYDVLAKDHQEMPFELNSPEYDLSNNLASVLNSQEFSDVVLSTNGKDFPAHKVILRARSKVFAAMFQHDMKENQQNRVDLENISFEVVEEMLRFIYTGKCEKLNEFTEELLVAADKYDLDRLKMMCSKALYSALSTENASHTLLLADMYNARELKYNVIQFIVFSNSDVFASAGWKDVILKPELVDEVCRAMGRQLTSLLS